MNIRTFARISLTFLAVLLLGSCASMNSDTSFLVNRLDDKAKSKVLVDAGAAEWNNVVIDQGQINKIQDIREYFVVAIHFNPQNQSAQRWLTNIEDYRNTKLRDSISDARNILKNKQRKEDDDYALAVAVRRATLIDPANGEVIKLLADTATVRNNLANVYTNRANASLAKISKSTSDATKESIYIDAFQNAVRATTADPKDSRAASLRNSMSTQIMDIVKKRLDAVPKLYESARFTLAKSQIDTAADLNRKSSGEFNTAITDAYYMLYYRWALYNYDHKDFSQAENRVSTALDYKRGSDAIDLQARISKQLDQVDQTVSFDTSIQNIDRLIASGDLVPAQRQITGVSATVKDQANQDQLELRRKKIQAAIADLYSKGVQFYRDENFGSAIDILQTVTALDPGYQQAADYLDKARQKKKLLDNY